jgi:hypothetical protein
MRLLHHFILAVFCLLSSRSTGRCGYFWFYRQERPSVTVRSQAVYLFRAHSLRIRLDKHFLTFFGTNTSLLESPPNLAPFSLDLHSPNIICAQQPSHPCTRPFLFFSTATMDDDETRKLVLRLQMEDLASIWASSTTSTDDAADLDADVSLRLYRRELRTAEQQIEDECSAQAVAQDELRQRDVIQADREAARRLFLELNPNEPLPEMVGDSELALTIPSTSGNAPLDAETPHSPGPTRSSEQPAFSSSPSLFSQHTALSSAGVKRSASHLETSDEPSSKKQAPEGISPALDLTGALSNSWSQYSRFGSTHGTPTFPDGPVTVAGFPVSDSGTLTGHKRPAEDDAVIAPPAKRQNGFFVQETTQFAAEPASAVSDPVISSQWSVPSTVESFGNSPRRNTEAPLLGQPAAPTRSPTSRSSFLIRTERSNSPDASTEHPEKPETQKVPTSRQPVAPGQQLAVEQVQSAEAECVACYKDLSRVKSHSNSCGHSYCKKCVNRLFRKAVRDESLWPPQCCKAEMAIEDVEHLLREDLVPSVKARQVEMSVPIPNRTYCVSCSEFIPLERIHEKSALCYKCWDSTCSECKAIAHVGDCQNKLEQDKDIKVLEALAEQEGWKKCSTCKMIVEHNTGCNHMT